MMTVAVSAASSPAGRAIHPTPPNAQLYTEGPFCPIDKAKLRARLDGFICPACWAGWNCHGLAGRWLPLPGTTEAVRLRRLDQRLATTIGLGFGGAVALAAGLQVAPVADEVPVDLVWTLVLVLIVAAGLVVAWDGLAGWIERRRYASNEIVAVYASVEQALAAPVANEIPGPVT